MNLLIASAEIGGGVLFATSALTAITLRRVVPTNRVDIVQSSGKTTSYGKDRANGNVYYAWPPWLPVIGVTVTHFPESVFTVELKDYAAYDVGRLPFLVDIMGFFRIGDSDKAAHRVADFAELQMQLHSVMESTVRSVLASAKLEDIMQDRVVLAGEFTKAINASLEEWGVTTVKDIAFMDIRDQQGQEVIANIMAKEKSRIARESRVVQASNNQAAQTAEIEANREVGMRQQEAVLQVGQAQALAEKGVGIAEQQAKQEILTESKTTAEREMEVKQVTDVRTAEIARSVAEVSADQQRKVLVVNSDAERQRLELVATGQLEANKREAEGVRIKGEAEGAAQTAVNLAAVSPQITLAKEIGGNEGYQTYLVSIEKVRAGQAVGIAQADALKAADIKVIVTGGDVPTGMGNITELFSAKGGQAIGAMLEGLSQTDSGKAVVDRVTKKPNGEARA
jgi:flotillin